MLGFRGLEFGAQDLGFGVTHKVQLMSVSHKAAGNQVCRSRLLGLRVY